MAKNKRTETGSMADKLAVVKKKVTRQRGRFIDHNGYTIALRKHAHPDEAGIDGTDHINLGFSPTTYIGRRLSVSVVSGRIRHPKLGKFSSMSHFAGWVTAVDRNDDMRNGRAQRTSGEFPVNYVAMVAEALWHSVKGDKRLAEELRRNELPFDCYRVFDSGERRRVNTFLIAIAEQITLALRQSVELDIDGFKADSTVGLYHGTGIEETGVRRVLPDLETAAAKVFGKPRLDFQNGEPKTKFKIAVDATTNSIDVTEVASAQSKEAQLRGENAVVQTVDELPYAGAKPTILFDRQEPPVGDVQVGQQVEVGERAPQVLFDMVPRVASDAVLDQMKPTGYAEQSVPEGHSVQEVEVVDTQS